MTSEQNRSLDVFGVRPAAEAVSHLSKAIVDGAGAFLARICLPAAEELGLLLRDRVSNWRAKNATKIVLESSSILQRRAEEEEVHAHPRIVSAVIEKGSWTDDPQLQHMWAGLLASSCTSDGRDYSNLMFANILEQLTPSQALLVRMSVRRTRKLKVGAGWIASRNNTATASLTDLVAETGISDPIKIDLELDHLRALGLLDLDGGFPVRGNVLDADITATAFSLHFFARCEGHIGSLDTFYSDVEVVSVDTSSVP